MKQFFVIIILAMMLMPPSFGLESSQYEMDTCFQKHFKKLLLSMEKLGAVESFEIDEDAFIVNAPNYVIHFLNHFYEGTLPETATTKKEYDFDLQKCSPVKVLFSKLMGFKIIKIGSAEVGKSYQSSACRIPKNTSVQLQATEYVHQTVNLIAQHSLGFSQKRLFVPNRKNQQVIDYMQRLIKRDLLYYDNSEDAIGGVILHFRTSRRIFEEIKALVDGKTYRWETFDVVTELTNNHLVLRVIEFYQQKNQLKIHSVGDIFPETYHILAPHHVYIHLEDVIQQSFKQTIKPEKNYGWALHRELERLAVIGEIKYDFATDNHDRISASYQIEAYDEAVMRWVHYVALTGKTKLTFEVDCNPRFYKQFKQVIRAYVQQGSLGGKYKVRRDKTGFKLTGPGYVRDRLRKLYKLYHN